MDFLLQVLAKPLRKAACDVQLLDFPLLAQLGIFQDGINGFLLRIANKAAGIDNDHVRLPVRVVANRITMLQQSSKMLRIDFVLGAAEGNDI